MKKTALALTVTLTLLFTLNLGYCYTSNAAVPFSYDDLASTLTIYSPAKNFTYSDSDIMINASLYIGYHESEPGTHYIPYQNISCVYSLDGSEWQNMSLISVYIYEPFSSMVNPVWYSTAELNYSATLYDLPEGEHHLQFSLKPDALVNRLTVSHIQDDYSTNYQDYVNFAVNATDEEVPASSSPSPSPTTTSFSPDLSLMIVSIAVSVTVVCIVSLVYFKKLRGEAEP